MRRYYISRIALQVPYEQRSERRRTALFGCLKYYRMHVRHRDNISMIQRPRSRDSALVDERLDVRRKMCPIPVLLTKCRMQELKKGKVLEIVGDDPRARDNIETWARDAGHEVLKTNDSRSAFRIKIRRG